MLSLRRLPTAGALRPSSPRPAPSRAALRVAAFKWDNASSGKREARPQNVTGDFFVDSTCIGAPPSRGRAYDPARAAHSSLRTAACALQPGRISCWGSWGHLAAVSCAGVPTCAGLAFFHPADCDTCRWMAPGVFHEAGCMSAVHRQPQDAEERRAALQALLSCPT